MKKYMKEFVSRGLMCACGGPLILAVIYGVMEITGEAASLAPGEVCIAILTISLLAFIAAGITTVYQIEQLPLLSAVLIHGGVLYLDYLLVYFVNRWIPRNGNGVGIFTAVFVLAYAVTWLCIYLIIRAKTERMNQKLKQ